MDKKKRKQNATHEETRILSIQKKEKIKPADGKSRKKRRSRFEVTERSDIRYRGPLSYRHMMILGWLCIILKQVGLILTAAGHLDASITASAKPLISFGDFAGSLFMPFLLLGNFSQILSSKQRFKALLLKYGGLSAAMGLAPVVVYEHFIKGIADTTSQLVPGLGEEFLLFFQKHAFGNGYLAYNMFIDLFLCTLFMFFLTYHFKRPIKRGWLIGFRLLSILPVAYELASIVLKTLCKNGTITLPMYVSPFLTTKPPMTFAAFIALALFIKRRERIFLQNDKNYDDYGHFLETNANSLHFSVHACITFVIAAIVDLIILIIFTTILTAGDVVASGQLLDEALENDEMMNGIITRTAYVAVAAGFGESVVLLFIAPLVLLFSYTRKPKNTNLDVFIPMIAIVIIVALYTEALFQGIRLLPDLVNAYVPPVSEAELSQLGLSEAEMLEIMRLLAQPGI